jgi:hypothetical protein
MTAPPGPMIRAAGLWRKTSNAGNEYFVGRLGGAKVVILANRDRGDDEKQPTHYLFFAEASERPQNAPRSEGRSDRTPAAPRNAHARRSGQPRDVGPVRPDSVPMPDDPMSDLWPGR